MPPSPARPRLRLKPEARIPLILDAALAEFSARGYGGTRMDDIARRAGLSKGGLYAHFVSKENVFDALLRRSLSPPQLDVAAMLDGASTLEGLADQLVAALHAGLADAGSVATARLLLAEGYRAPEVVRLWHTNLMEALLGQLADLIEQAHARGLCARGILSEEPRFIVSPVVHWMVQQIALGPLDETGLAAARQTHARLLCALLAPRAGA